MRVTARDWRRFATLAAGGSSRRSKERASSVSGREFAASPGTCFRAVLPVLMRPKARPRVFVSDRAFREGFARRGLRKASAEEAFPIAWTAMRSLTPAATRELEAGLRQALAVEMRRAGLVPFARPLAVSLDFVLPGEQRLAPVGKRDGDLDNLEKLALDAMNGVVFEDDRLVVMKWSRKSFGPEPRVSVLVGEIPQSSLGACAVSMFDGWFLSRAGNDAGD